jgi:hypothetical protein
VEINVANAFRFQTKFNKKLNKIVAEVTMKQYKRVLIKTHRKPKITDVRVDSIYVYIISKFQLI